MAIEFWPTAGSAVAQAYAIQRANHTGTQTLSTISDAGTAAAADVTDSVTDTTTGRLLKVGIMYHLLRVCLSRISLKRFQRNPPNETHPRAT